MNPCHLRHPYTTAVILSEARTQPAVIPNQPHTTSVILNLRNAGAVILNERSATAVILSEARSAQSKDLLSPLFLSSREARPHQRQVPWSR